MLQVKRMYKIHCISVADGTFPQPSCNGVFYNTVDEAIIAAKQHVRDDVAMVIYKAHILVRRERPPIEVLAVESDGIIVELSDRKV